MTGRICRLVGLLTTVLSANAHAADAPRILVHSDAQGLTPAQEATVIAPPMNIKSPFDHDGVAGGILMARALRGDAAWQPAQIREGNKYYTQARLAPGRHELAVGCWGLRWSNVFVVEVNTVAGHSYRLICDVVKIDQDRVAAKVVVSDEGMTRRQ